MVKITKATKNSIEKQVNEKAGKAVKKIATKKRNELAKEISKLASKANKRIKRLEQRDLTSSHAYQKYLRQGGKKFSVKGKTYQQLQSELAKIRGFINSETSTVRGVNSVLKKMASSTGLKYKKLSELHAISENFFKLASKIEQSLDAENGSSEALGYRAIWDTINDYVKNAKINLASGKLDIDKLTKKIGSFSNVNKIANQSSDSILDWN